MKWNTQTSSLLALVAVSLAAALLWLVLSGTGDAVPAVGDPAATAAGTAGGAAGERPASGPVRMPISAQDGPAGLDAVRIRGRILDAFGEPLGSALVGEATSDQPTVTPADGRFELVVPGGRPIPLLVLATAHAPSVLTLEVQAGARSHELGDLQLLRGGGLRGRITDGTAAGLAGATVTAQFQPGSAWPAGLDPGRLLVPGTTDADGGYYLLHLAPGSYRLLATAPGRQGGQSAALTVRDGFETAVDPIALGVGYSLSGLVLGPGDLALAGASVRIRGGGGNQPRLSAQAETGVDGRFRIEALPPGLLRVEVTRSGFLRSSRADVDASRGEELVVRLAGGLRITGTVANARGGQPVERFAVAVRRLGELDPQGEASMTQQLRRQVEALEAAEATTTDLAQRAEKRRIAAELAARLAGLSAPGAARPAAVPADLGPVAEHPDGRFAIEGLEEGVYSVGVASPDHQFVQAEPLELRAALPAPDLRLVLTAGATVSGVVTARPGRVPIGGATVELVWLFDAPRGPQEARRSLYPWVFARAGPPGATLMTTRTAADGSFGFRPAPPGRYCLSVRHQRIADHDTAAFELAAARREVRVEVGGRASLTGRIGNVPPAWQGNVSVLVLGGHGALRTVKAAADGTYRHDGLQPGSYLVRAFPADASQYVNRLFGDLFPLHAGAVDTKRIPECDVTLAEGEVRRLDLVLDLPATGVAEGTVSINSRPGKGAVAILRPVAGEAPGAGGLALRGSCDDLGRFTIGDVPAGNYTLVVQGPTRQELYGKPLRIEPGATSPVRVEIAAGGLRGQVVVPDAAPKEELRGYVWVLPGAKEAPADLYEYRRANRTHRIAVRNGVFEDTGLTPGPAFVIADLRGRNRVATQAVIPAGDTVVLDLTVGGRQ